LPKSPSSTAGAEQRVRIVFALDNLDVGGSELNAVRTAEHLDRERFDLRIVCMKPKGRLVDRCRAIGVPIIHVRVKSLHGWTMATAGWQFASYLRAERVQIVHAHDMYSNVFAVPWARAARTPVIIASRRWWYTLPSVKLRLGNTLAFRMASAVLANSARVAASVQGADGVSPERIRVVPNFASDTAFEALSDECRDRRRRELGIPADRFLVGCVARLVPVKDHATLLRASAIARQAKPRMHLLIVGDGPCRPELETLAAELNLTDAVTFVGERSDGGNYHALCDASALSSISEGFPNTLVEAMAAGRPVVATAVGGTLDAVVDGVTGILVKAGDANELAAALVRLADAPALREQMGTAGHRRAMNEYRATDVVAGLEGLYLELLAGRGA
jgi:glycosyltransferase involved in cell wall biosynthesis